MTDSPNRLELTQALAIRNTEAIAGLTTKVDNLADKVNELTDNVNELTDNVTRVLARSAILDDVLLDLRDSHARHQQNFERHQQNFNDHQRNFERLQHNFNEHQLTTNAALSSLEAILLQLIRIFPQS